MTYNEHCKQNKCELECCCKSCIRKINNEHYTLSEFHWAYCSFKEIDNGSPRSECISMGVGTATM